MTTSSDIDLMNLQPFASGYADEVFKELRDHDPLHWNAEPDGAGFWSVTRYADVKAVASDYETFTVTQGTQIASRRAEGEGARSIHHVDPPEHGPLRKIVTPSVRPAKVKNLAPDIEAVIDELLDKTVGAGSLDFVAEISSQLPLVMIGRLLGAPLEDCPNLLRWTNQMASEDPDYSEGPDTAVRARDEVFAYFRGLEEQRRACPADDLISILTAAEIDGVPLSRGYLDAYYLILMVAGNETTRNLLSGGVLALHENPQGWQMLRDNPGKIRTAVEEMVRWVSPVLSMRRTATRDVEMHGKTIKTGDKVVMWFCSANRDERAFEDPDVFRPDRFPNEHLGFGWGDHACLGANLARLEAKLFFTKLVERGIDLSVVGEADRLKSNFFRGIKTLPATLEQRHG
ncbi:cytochrome P450 [Rhodococcus pyridinivorans]|uniref:cytochrome P450 n=1 Tax=Rhodococcus pyridinivorans TaxID=103816 RepID=UPI0022837359|nr:cytochrome P450 [Rhodococcus pyridinivorans]WAL49278.1 cytochrome P450 [Rhodococcus pyridinivorans]